MNGITRDQKKQVGQQEEEVDVASIYAAFEKVKNGRKKQGLRYPLSFILTILVLGKMAGEQKIKGIVDWAKEREPWLKKQRNWPKSLPVEATVSNALALCDAEEVEQAMMGVLRKAREDRQKEEERQERVHRRQKTQKLRHLAIDGKRSVELKSINQRISRLCTCYRCMNAKQALFTGIPWLRRRKMKSREQRHFLISP